MRNTVLGFLFLAVAAVSVAQPAEAGTNTNPLTQAKQAVGKIVNWLGDKLTLVITVTALPSAPSGIGLAYSLPTKKEITPPRVSYREINRNGVPRARR